MISVATMRENAFCDRPKVTMSNRSSALQKFRIVVRNSGAWFVMDPFSQETVAQGKAANKTLGREQAVKAKKALQEQKR